MPRFRYVQIGSCNVGHKRKNVLPVRRSPGPSMVDSLASAEVTWAERGRHVEGIEGNIVGVMSEDVVEHTVLLTLLLGENV